MSAAPILTILRDGEPVKSQAVTDEVVLGRSEGCVIRLDDRAISRQHAVFRRTGDGLQVEKKSQFAPMLINGADVTRAVIKEGDVIEIGPYLIKMSLEKGAGAVSAGPAIAPIASVTSQTDTVRQSDSLATTLVEEVLPEVSLSSSELNLLSDPAQATALPALDTAVMDTAQLAESPPSEGGTGFIVPPEGVELGVDSISDSGFAEVSQSEAVAGPGAEIDLGEQDAAQEISLAPPDADSDLDTAAPAERADLGQPVEPTPMVDSDASTRIVAPESNVAVKLLFRPGGANVSDYELVKNEIYLGRGKECEIVLNDKKASRRHIKIRREGDHFLIADLESSNGTYINGEKLTQERELVAGDQIKVGEVEFQYDVLKRDFAGALPSLDDLQANPAELNTPLEVDTGSISDDGPTGLFQFPPVAPPPMQPPPISGQVTNPGIFNPPINPAEAGTIPGFTGIPGMDPIPGLSDAGLKKNASLMERFRALPKRRQYIWAAIIIALFYFLFVEEDEQIPVKKAPAKKPGIVGTQAPKGVPTWESLTPEQKKFVEAQHALAFEHYKNKDYDKALYEIRKIFPIIPDYKDSKEIERYAEEGKRKLEAIEDEKRKREEESKLKSKVAQLVEETRDKMNKKQYEQAKDLFYQILSLDPDNTQVSEWKKAIEEYEEQKKLEAQQRAIQDEINKRGWEEYKEGLNFKTQGKLYSAIGAFERVKDIGVTDKTLLRKVEEMIRASKGSIWARRDPLLREAKQAEDGGDLSKAYRLYRQATRVDPNHPAGYQGMNRIRGVLHERARAIYTEAVLAESYSDFILAKKKFQECYDLAPEDDIYRARAKNKLYRYVTKLEAAS